MLTVMLGLVGFGVIEFEMVGDRVAEMHGLLPTPRARKNSTTTADAAVLDSALCL